MIADSVEYLAGHGRRVLVDMEHFFDGYKANPEFSLRALEAAVVKGASHVVLCDTNGGSLPHEIGEIVAAVRGPRRHGRHRRHPLPRRHRLRRRQLDGRRARRRRPRAGHAQRPRRAHRQRQPHDDHPQPAAQAGLHVPARRPHRAAHGGQPPRRRAAQPGRQPAGAVRRLVGVRPQGRPAHQRHRPGQGRLRARRPRARRQRHPVRRQRDGRAGDDHDEGRRARPRHGRPGRQHRDRRPQAARARGLPLRGRRRLARAADAAGGRLGARLLPGREHAGDHRRAAERRLHDRGDGQGVGRGGPPGVHRRGQRSGQRHRHGAAQRAQRRLPASSTGCT